MVSVFVRATATLEYLGKSEQNTLDTYQYVHCNEETWFKNLSSVTVVVQSINVNAYFTLQLRDILLKICLDIVGLASYRTSGL